MFARKKKISQYLLENRRKSYPHYAGRHAAVKAVPPRGYSATLPQPWKKLRPALSCLPDPTELFYCWEDIWRRLRLLSSEISANKMTLILR